jgi:hypothetical protein
MSKTIKNQVFFFLILLLSSSALNAQIVTSLGLRGGLNFANIKGDVSQSSAVRKSKVGMNLGALLDVSFNRNVSLRLETNFSIRGATLNSIDTVACDPNNVQTGAVCNGNSGQNISLIPREATINITYLEVPILFNYMFEGASLRPSILVGASFDFLLNANQNRYTFFNNSSVYNKQNTDLIFGVGINQEIAGGKFIALEARYYLGLSDIHSSESLNQQHRVFSLNAVYTFPLSRKYISNEEDTLD